MDYNYHTHTYRCSHATGEPEEYVKRAISCGIKYMGFSDHVPFICKNGSESGYRVPYKDAEEYCNDIKLLAEKYKKQIEIKVGYEMEYYPEDFEKMLAYAKKTGAEYLILGEHVLNDEGSGAEFTWLDFNSVDCFKLYVSRLVEGIKTGVFTYVAHPDMFNYTADLEIYRQEMRKVCVASREYNIPLEINFLGIRGKRSYPMLEFIKLMGEEKNPVTFGFDAHDVQSAFDGESLETALKYVEEYKLNYIGKPNIISISKSSR